MNKDIFKYFAIRYDIQSKLEFYGRVRKMIIKHRRKMEERLMEELGKKYEDEKLYGASIITFPYPEGSING